MEGPCERYRLDWPGKRQAMLLANTPTTKTLRPVRDDSVDFDTTRNLFIEGDNLEALKILQETYLGQVKMIYIDPPYNTGKDFIYRDNFRRSAAEELEASGQADETGRLVANTEANGRFHSDWLSMMAPRLKLARSLLRDDGVLILSIGQEELSRAKQLLDVSFGHENHVSTCARVAKTGGQKGTHFSPSIDFLIFAARQKESLGAFREPISEEVKENVYTQIEEAGERKGEKFRQMGLYQAMLEKRANQRYFIECPDGSLAIPPGQTFPETIAEGDQCKPKDGDGVWRWTYSRFREEKKKDNISIIRTGKSSLVNHEGKPSPWNVYYKIWLSDRLQDGQLPGNIFAKFQSRHASAEMKALDIPFDFSKPSELIAYMMSLIIREGDIVCDFFAGSGSTAHAAMIHSAKISSTACISIQLDEEIPEEDDAWGRGYRSIAQLSRERIRRAGAKILADHPEAKDSLDVGFRAFRIDGSNFHDTRLTTAQAEAVATDDAARADLLDGLTSHIKDDRTDEDLLFGALLAWGVDITLPIRRATVAGREVILVDPPEDSDEDAALIACFAQDVDVELAAALAALSPRRVVFRDDGFVDDATKENVASRFQQLAPDTTLRVL